MQNNPENKWLDLLKEGLTLPARNPWVGACMLGLVEGVYVMNGKPVSFEVAAATIGYTLWVISRAKRGKNE